MMNETKSKVANAATTVGTLSNMASLPFVFMDNSSVACLFLVMSAVGFATSNLLREKIINQLQDNQKDQR